MFHLGRHLSRYVPIFYTRPDNIDESFLLQGTDNGTRRWRNYSAEAAESMPSVNSRLRDRHKRLFIAQEQARRDACTRTLVLRRRVSIGFLSLRLNVQ